jgi:hypothetical protein
MANEKVHTNTQETDTSPQPVGGEQFVADTQEAREERTDRTLYVRGPGKSNPTWANLSRVQRAYNNVRDFGDPAKQPRAGERDFPPEFVDEESRKLGAKYTPVVHDLIERAQDPAELARERSRPNQEPLAPPPPVPRKK